MTVKNDITTFNTVSVIENAIKRQKASQMILLAIVAIRPHTMEELQISLQSCIPEIKKVAQKTFYFDLGWLENLNTTLDEFEKLNLIREHHSEVTYESTDIGKARLIEEWNNLRDYLNSSLEEFQEHCKTYT